jgi:hypothetical protein
MKVSISPIFRIPVSPFLRTWNAFRLELESSAQAPTGERGVVTSIKIRLAALIAFRNSASIFISTLLFVPVSALINRIFHDSWYVNWRLMLTISGTLTCIFFTFFFVSQAIDDRADVKGEQQIGNEVFRGVAWLRGIYLFGIVMGSVLVVGAYRENDPTWIVITPVAFILLGIIPWPRAIQVRNGEIRQRDALFRIRIIPSGEIESASFDPTSGDTMVFGKNGTKIVHSNLHLSTELFIEEVERLSNKKVVFLDGK